MSGSGATPSTGNNIEQYPSLSVNTEQVTNDLRLRIGLDQQVRNSAAQNPGSPSSPKMYQSGNSSYWKAPSPISPLTRDEMQPNSSTDSQQQPYQYTQMMDLSPGQSMPSQQSSSHKSYNWPPPNYQGSVPGNAKNTLNGAQAQGLLFITVFKAGFLASVRVGTGLVVAPHSSRVVEDMVGAPE